MTQASPAVDGSLLPPTTDRDATFLAPGVPGYQIVRELGRGGAGVVYLAWQDALERFVALKALQPHLVDSEWASRFEREALALARVQHPNVVPVLSYGTADGTPYLSMQYVLGDTLQNALDGARGEEPSRLTEWFTRTDGNAPYAAALVVAIALADALDDVHRAGIVHRDIKPANVVIDAKGRPTLVDFGVACDPHSHRLAPEEGSTGTPRYMAPEQIDAPADEIDGRADIYALGLVLFEMLTLQPAFPQNDIEDLVVAIREGDIPSLRALDPKIPEILDQIVRKATATRAANRYQSAHGMCHALRDAATSLGIVGFSSLGLGPELQRSLEDSKPRSGASDLGMDDPQFRYYGRIERAIAFVLIATTAAFALGYWLGG